MRCEVLGNLFAKYIVVNGIFVYNVNINTLILINFQCFSFFYACNNNFRVVSLTSYPLLLALSKDYVVYSCYAVLLCAQKIWSKVRT